MKKSNLPNGIQIEMKKYSKFQQEVWKACASIPRGETKTYGWIAARIGRPKASRAVGQALKINPFAPTIPCHRVVPASGGLGHYSGPGGKSQKEALLIREGAIKKYPAC